MRTYNIVHCLSTNLNVNNCLCVYSILYSGDANEWLACKKTRQIFHRKKSVLVLYYSFLRGVQIWVRFFKAGKNMFLNYFPGKKNNFHSDSDSSRKMSNITPKKSIILWEIHLVFCVVVPFPVMGSPDCKKIMGKRQSPINQSKVRLLLNG